MNSMSYAPLHSLSNLIGNRTLPLLSIIVLMYTIVMIGNLSAANSVIDEHSYLTHKTRLISNNQPPQLASKVAGDKFTVTGNLREAIRSLVNNGTNAAIVIGLVSPNGTQFYGYGKMSAANHTTVNENTLFGIGSMTKSFTTLLLADMANRGMVNLDDTIGKYLPPGIKSPTFNGQQITLEELATHTSGLSHDPPNMSLDGPGFQKYTLEQMYHALSNTNLTRLPGTKYQYSNFGMALLGSILASKVRVPYEQLVIQRILSPLGMNSTRISLTKPLESRLAIGHRNGHQLPIIEDPPPYAPAGGFRSTALDMAKYLAASMGLTKTNLSSAMELSHLPRFNTGIGGFGGHSRIYVGLAWFTTYTPDTSGITQKLIWDNGQFNGYNGFIGFNPNAQRGVVILCSGVQKSLSISQIGFGPYDNLSNIILNSLNR